MRRVRRLGAERLCGQLHSQRQCRSLFEISIERPAFDVLLLHTLGELLGLLVAHLLTSSVAN